MENRNIEVTIERPNGTTYHQLLELVQDADPENMVRWYQNNVLGDPYNWYTDSHGKHKRYIKKDAYLVVDWHWA